MKNKQCPHCFKNFELIKIQAFANHVRWCKENPKYEEIKNKTNTSLNETLKEKKEKELKSFSVSCEKCFTTFNVIEKIEKFPQKEKYFCSRKCANIRIHTEENKKKISEGMTEYNKSIGIEPKKLLEKECLYCSKVFSTYKNIRKFCTSTCSNKHRSTLHRANRSDLINYRNDCCFTFTLSNYPKEFDFDLVAKYRMV